MPGFSLIAILVITVPILCFGGFLVVHALYGLLLRDEIDKR